VFLVKLFRGISMPIYEYECEACSHQLEALQKLSDAPLLVCPSCDAPRLRKKISAAAFRLKGGGWYETDFKSGNKKNVAEGSGTAPAAAPAATPAPSRSAGSGGTGS
jgi:putative FmdB family regulatory protein